MPQSGYSSITVAATVYDRFVYMYKRDQEHLARIGIRSFSAYVSHRIKDCVYRIDAHVNGKTPMKIVYSDNRRTILIEKEQDRAVDMVLKDDRLRCTVCERYDCIHIGYALGTQDADRWAVFHKL